MLSSIRNQMKQGWEMSEITLPPELAAIYDRLAQIGKRLNGKIVVSNNEGNADRNSNSLIDEHVENKQLQQGGEHHG